MENGSLKYDKKQASDNHNYGRFRSARSLGGVLMGELTFIKNGLATTIHDNGDMTVLKAQQCDQCNKWDTALGGFSVRDIAGEVVMWLCAQCRA